MRSLLTTLGFILLIAGYPQADEIPHLEWLIRKRGGRVDWGATGQLAYDAPGKDGYTDVWVMDPDGANRRCLTAGHPKIPQQHNGNPAWHPSGELLVFQSLDPEIKGPLVGTPGYRLYTGPGAGFHNDLWVTDAEGLRAWRLTRVGRGKGVLHPHFSHDGRWLVWAEMVSSKPRGLGSWEIVLARFEYDGKDLSLGTTKRMRPGNLQFYETHGFSPDDTQLIFSGVPQGKHEESMDIYLSDLNGDSLKRLTELSQRQWDEHAHFSPDGESIYWMSSSGNGLKPSQINNLGVKTDVWKMKADGSDKKRVTSFHKPGSPHYLPGRNIASDMSFSPDGTRLLLYVQDKGKKLFTWGSIAIIELRK